MSGDSGVITVFNSKSSRRVCKYKASGNPKKYPILILKDTAHSALILHPNRER